MSSYTFGAEKAQQETQMEACSLEVNPVKTNGESYIYNL